MQVIVTTQSADLIDRDDVDPDWIRAVSNDRGLTEIGTVDAASLRAMRERLFTPGELMRAGQIGPDTEAGSVSVPDPVTMR